MLSTEAEVVQSLVGTLKELPDSDAHVSMEGPHGAAYDAQVEASISGRNISILVEVKKQVFPRDVHQYLFQIREIMRRAEYHFGDSMMTMLAAHSISPGAKEILRAERAAYYDIGGSLFISSNGMLVDRLRPPAPSEERAMRTLFTGTRARVLLAMLDRPKEWINVKHLSADAEVSMFTASEVLQALERNDWVKTDGAGPTKQRRLTRPGDVLDAWAKFVQTRKAPKQRRYFISTGFLKTSFHMPEVLEKHQIDYAVTGEAAAQHYSPWLTQVSVQRLRMVYSDTVEAALGELDAKLVTDGANVFVIEVASPKDIAYRKRENGVWYAHPIQVYLDLLRLEGRAPDAAKNLREKVIGF